MRDLHVYEIVSATGTDGTEFGLLTGNGLGNGTIEARIKESDIEITSTKEAVRLKDVSQTVLDFLNNGSSFYIINLEQDSVEKVGIRY